MARVIRVYALSNTPRRRTFAKVGQTASQKACVNGEVNISSERCLIRLIVPWEAPLGIQAFMFIFLSCSFYFHRMALENVGIHSASTIAL